MTFQPSTGARSEALQALQADLEAREATRNLTAEGLTRWALPCSPEQLEQLMRFRDILLEWNAERMNLTRLTNPTEIAAEHFLDSLSLLTVLDIPGGSSLLDVGAGAGFPSLPLAILRPDLRVTLLEATAKKLAFCEAAAAATGLDMRRLRFIHGRAEDQRARAQLSGRFDIVTARAVAPLVKLAPWCAAYLKRPAGVLAAFKSARANEEAAEAAETLRALGLAAKVYPVDVLGSPRTHTIILCRPS